MKNLHNKTQGTFLKDFVILVGFCMFGQLNALNTNTQAIHDLHIEENAFSMCSFERHFLFRYVLLTQGLTLVMADLQKELNVIPVFTISLTVT